MSALSDLTIVNARRYATGESLETDGPNDGPEIRDWLAAVGIHHPAAWCAAFACAMIREAAATLQQTMTMRYSAGALRLLDLNPHLKLADPEPGAVVIWDHGHGLGHVGIITEVTPGVGHPISLRAISGNTNADGSRDADRVWERDFQFPQVHPIAGYLRIA